MDEGLGHGSRIVAGCVLAALLTACGGGGGSSPTGSGSNTPPSNSGSSGSTPGTGGGTTPGSGSNPPASAPVISSQPLSQRTASGDTAIFSVTATSAKTLSYQWRKDGVNIAGATNSSYETPAVGLVDSGSRFTVVVSDADGSVTSTDATLTAFANPEGIFRGTLTDDATSTSQPMLAFLLKDGTATLFLQTDTFVDSSGEAPLGALYNLNGVVPDLDAFHSGYESYTQVGRQFANGSQKVSGGIDGDIDSSVALTGTYSASTNETGTYQVQYEAAQYEQPAAGTTIEGTYHYAQFFNGNLVSGVATFTRDGTWSGSDDNGCTFTGTYSIPDPTRNLYAVSNDEVCVDNTGTHEHHFKGLQTFFPEGTGADFNNGVNFTTDTLIVHMNDGYSGYMVIAHK